jgi:hypothetical protein
MLPGKPLKELRKPLAKLPKEPLMQRRELRKPPGKPPREPLMLLEKLRERRRMLLEK